MDHFGHKPFTVHRRCDSYVETVGPWLLFGRRAVFDRYAL